MLSSLSRRFSQTGFGLIMHNLHWSASKEQIQALVKSVGQVAEVKVPKGEGSRNRGYAIVRFRTESARDSALSSLSFSDFMGRKLSVRKLWNREEVLEEAFLMSHTEPT